MCLPLDVYYIVSVAAHLIAKDLRDMINLYSDGRVNEAGGGFRLPM